MAALGTIRKRGVILVCIISFGLFAFIAEEVGSFGNHYSSTSTSLSL